MPRIVPALLVSCLIVGPAAAQDPELSLDTTVVFYGDNTEFSNPFREGETLLGTFAELVLEARLNERFALRGGVFGNQRFGSEDAFDEVRPVLTMVIGGPRSRLILGTLETVRQVDGAGPDRMGLHGLLPPVQRETLAFERPWEAGLQWKVASSRVTQDAWVNWQRLNAHGRREIFDTGLSSRVRLRPALVLRGDAHLVHHGGQQPSSEPVSDSFAANLGVDVGGPVGRLDRVSLEAFALMSRDVPDREERRARFGFATFIRTSVENAGWRAHGILWRGDDFIKEEGDPNYQSRRRDGTRYGGLRDYAEAGLTRTFGLAMGASLEMSARWHRVENDYEYSFRVLGIARLHHRFGR